MILAHNLEAMNTNRQYGIVTKNKDKAAERLASGYKINRAADNAAGLQISEKMRSQVRGLQQAARNVQDGNSLTNVADGGIHEIHALLQRQRELLVQAANDVNTDADRANIEEELATLADELDRMYGETEFNTIKIFKGGEEYVDGPDVTANSNTTTVVQKLKDRTVTKLLWLPDTANPQDDVNIVTSSRTVPHATYSETEEVIDIDENQHETVKFSSDYTNTLVTTTRKDIISTTYEELTTDADYTSLRNPGVMVRNGGYINVQTKAGGLDLSCAMSQLAVKVDGTLIGNYDMYNNSSVQKTTTISADQKTATTKYNLGNGVSVSQKVVLQGVDTYDISYSVENTDGQAHNIEIRFAFDVMNTPSPNLTDTHRSGTSFTLENDDAKIGIQTTGTADCCLGDISTLYGTFDNNVQDGQKVMHTGLGCWWSTTAAANSGPTELGGVSYGPIQLKKKLYRQTDVVKSEIQVDTEVTTEHTEATIKPKYLDIQAGANSFQNIPVRLWDLSIEKMKCRVPEEISAFNASDCLEHIDRVIDKMSMIRSYYGAVTNRMEYAEKNDTNAAENTQAAESRIRDADMADEMVVFSKESILQQAATSMLAQANQSKQGILSLLNG